RAVAGGVRRRGAAGSLGRLLRGHRTGRAQWLGPHRNFARAGGAPRARPQHRRAQQAPPPPASRPHAPAGTRHGPSGKRGTAPVRDGNPGGGSRDAGAPARRSGGTDSGARARRDAGLPGRPRGHGQSLSRGTKSPMVRHGRPWMALPRPRRAGPALAGGGLRGSHGARQGHHRAVQRRKRAAPGRGRRPLPLALRAVCGGRG
ncbi:hypothetical protein H632_c4936p0, partial [Helicosporidium sp. ATCC 50920]